MSTQPEALRLADELEDDLADYGGQSLPRISQDIADNAAAELRRLHAENASLSAALASSCDEQRHELWESSGVAGCERARVAERQRDALLEALKNILPFVATQAIGCHGYKCREQWCWSCYGEEDAEEAASQALVLANEASRIVEEVEETK